LSAAQPEFVPPLPVRQREPRLRYIILFLLTLASTTLVGQAHYASFSVGFSDQELLISAGALAVRGLLYSVPVLLILGCHEFGHYFACRYYGVDASLPYFLPMPLVLTGTLGAVIRIRQPIPTKRALFDIGIAGPIAGFVVAIPVLIAGMYLSNVVPIPADFRGSVIEFGEPLLFKAAAWLRFGAVADGYTVNMHPMVFAAWFGMLATALNLFPIGQLDGGHISYSVLGGRSTAVTFATVLGLVLLSVFFSHSWVIWTVLSVVMLFVFGPRHPRVWDEHVPLDRTRLWLALFAVVMFILCFTPAPLEFKDIVPGVRV
jgi:membrane-associated protease RseP (regulator of RpoE activity)